MKKLKKTLFVSTVSASLLLALSPNFSQTDPSLFPVSPISVEASSNTSTFLKEAKSLPNISLIHQMTRGVHGIMDFDATKSDIIYTRKLYNELSNLEKNKAEVKKWAEYLSLKETAVGITFVNAARSLPSVSSLKSMTDSQLDIEIKRMTTIRKAYNQLSPVAKGDADVIRWESYLSDKEQAVTDGVTYFVKKARDLPNISAIAKMDSASFQATKINIQETRNTYKQLSSSDKNHADVILWESYLSEKEHAIGLDFITQVRNLPSVSAIEKMDDAQKSVFANELTIVRNTYHALIGSAKLDSDVIRWEGYLSQKEAAISLNKDLVKERINQINQKWAELKPSVGKVAFVEQPSTKHPYALGKLSDTTYKEALDVTNFIRYVSDLPYDLQLVNEYNKEAQAASVVNQANYSLTHTPAKPAKMSEEMYQLGYRGANTSNLAMGFSSIIQSIFAGYMYDGDPYNVSHVGHRLSILSPKLQEVGFGYAHGSSAMKIITDNMWTTYSEPYDFIPWPAETAMPLNDRGQNIDLWGASFPWSVSLNPEIYDSRHLENIQVKLTRTSDNRTWNFNNHSSDGFFNVSTGNYGGLSFTVIFRPDNVDYNTGDPFRVTISGLKGKDGTNKSVSYETTFFELSN